MTAVLDMPGREASACLRTKVRIGTPVRTEVTTRTEPPVVTDADVFERAIDRIGEWGWCDGSGEENGPRCVGITIAESLRDLGMIDSFSFWGRNLPRLGFSDVPDLIHWNDREATKEEVVAKLREAAESARSSS